MLPKFMNISDIGLKNNNCLSVWGIGKKKISVITGPVKEKRIKSRIHQKKKKIIIIIIIIMIIIIIIIIINVTRDK